MNPTASESHVELDCGVPWPVTLPVWYECLMFGPWCHRYFEEKSLLSPDACSCVSVSDYRVDTRFRVETETGCVRLHSQWDTWEQLQCVGYWILCVLSLSLSRLLPGTLLTLYLTKELKYSCLVFILPLEFFLCLLLYASLSYTGSKGVNGTRVCPYFDSSVLVYDM